tara:strand:- start:4237 stop:5340 length:1104 start_codon:yes stop_codon:yes gene_type:complete
MIKPFITNFFMDSLGKFLIIITIYLASQLENEQVLRYFLISSAIIAIYVESFANYTLHVSIKKQENPFINLNLVFILVLGIAVHLFFQINLTLNLLLVILLAVLFYPLLFKRVTHQYKEEFAYVAFLNFIRPLIFFLSVLLIIFSFIEPVNFLLNVIFLLALISVPLILTLYKRVKFSDINKDIISYLFLIGLFGQIDYLISDFIYGVDISNKIGSLIRYASIPLMIITASNTIIFPLVKRRKINTSVIYFFLTFSSVLLMYFGIEFINALVGDSSVYLIYSFLMIVSSFIIIFSVNKRLNLFIANGGHSILAKFYLTLSASKIILFLALNEIMNFYLILGLSYLISSFSIILFIKHHERKGNLNLL